MAKRLNPNLAKIHRSYLVEEIAGLFSVHKNTVRSWVKGGLPTNDDKRPLLILGSELRLFLQSKREINKRKCKPFELYCLRCREPQVPYGNMVDYEPSNALLGCLVGICPVCNGIINKYASIAKLGLIKDKLEITFTRSLKHINESIHLPVNSDFSK